MTRFVIEPQIAIALAAADVKVARHHTLLAPTLLRSQVLALLYAEARSGQISRKEASLRLDYLRALEIRLLGDRVLQRVAWDIAQELGWQARRGLDEMCADTWRWQSQNPQGYPD